MNGGKEVNKLKAKIQHLTDERDGLKEELIEARRIIKRKEIELKAVLAQAEEVSHVDALTFLPNRRQIIKNLQNEVNRAERYKTPLSLSMIDIDHFKRVNDTYGHNVGDQVLLHLATLLQESIREPDMVGRYGGEEFLLVLPNTGLKEAMGQAARLCKFIRTTDIDSSEKIKLTISIGVAEYKVGEEGWREFLGRADTAMYSAKHDGRDRWAISE